MTSLQLRILRLSPSLFAHSSPLLYQFFSSVITRSLSLWRHLWTTLNCVKLKWSHSSFVFPRVIKYMEGKLSCFAILLTIRSHFLFAGALLLQRKFGQNELLFCCKYRVWGKKGNFVQILDFKILSNSKEWGLLRPSFFVSVNF